MLARMWRLSVSWWELILRVVIVYAFLLVLLRLSGKRQVGQLAPFDLVLLLVLSNSVQNAMNGGDNSKPATPGEAPIVQNGLPKDGRPDAKLGQAPTGSQSQKMETQSATRGKQTKRSHNEQ